MNKPPSIKFLVDESVEFRVVGFLRESNFDVIAITEDSPSISDIEVINLALKQKRVLITNDIGFGQLVFKERKKSYGVILIRMPSTNIQDKILKLESVINLKINQLPKVFITITEKQTRARLIPKI